MYYVICAHGDRYVKRYTVLILDRLHLHKFPFFLSFLETITLTLHCILYSNRLRHFNVDAFG